MPVATTEKIDWNPKGETWELAWRHNLRKRLTVFVSNESNLRIRAFVKILNTIVLVYCNFFAIILLSFNIVVDACKYYIIWYNQNIIYLYNIPDWLVVLLRQPWTRILFCVCYSRQLRNVEVPQALHLQAFLEAGHDGSCQMQLEQTSLCILEVQLPERHASGDVECF